MTKFDHEGFYRMMSEACEKLSEAQMTQSVRDKIRACLASNPTPRQLYDMMDEVSKIPIIKIPGTKICLGDISSFMQVLCDVTKYYERPAE